MYRIVLQFEGEEKIVDWALTLTGCVELRDHYLAKFSGCELVDYDTTRFKPPKTKPEVVEFLRTHARGSK